MAMRLPHLVSRRASLAALITLLLFVCLGGCLREERAEIPRLKSEVEDLQQKRTDAEKKLAMKADELALTTTSLEDTKTALAERDKSLVELQARFQSLQTEHDALKKNEAIVLPDPRGTNARTRTLSPFAAPTCSETTHKVRSLHWPPQPFPNSPLFSSAIPSAGPK